MLKLPGSPQSPQTWANAHEFQSWKTSTVDFQALPAGKVDLGSTPLFLPELSECPLVRNTRWMKGGLLPLEKRAFVLSVPAPVNSLLDCALLKLWNGDVPRRN